MDIPQVIVVPCVIIRYRYIFWDETWWVCFVSLPVGTMIASRDVVCVNYHEMGVVEPHHGGPQLLRESGTGKMIAWCSFIDDIYSRVDYVHVHYTSDMICTLGHGYG